MLIKEGKNRIRDLIQADINQGQLGTDGTIPTEDDTGLGIPIAATLATVTTTTADKRLIIDYTLSAGVGTGYTFREYEITSNASNTNFNRTTFYDLEQAESEEFQFSTIIDIE
jgi:hypothetical protein